MVGDEYIKYVESQVKLKLLDKVKDTLFSNKYFIVKAQIRESNQVDFNAANLHIKGELFIDNLTFKNLFKIIHLIK